MSTFIGQLIGFSILAFLAVKYLFPLIGGLMAKQQDAIRVALAASKSAADKLANADQAKAQMLAEAQTEGERIRSDAQSDSIRIAEQLGEQAATDADRIKALGVSQIESMRAQQIRALRGSLGADAVNRAEELVRAHVADAAAQAATVDRYLDELDSMAAGSAPLPSSVSLNLKASSRAAVEALVAKFETVSNTVDTDGLVGFADELGAVGKLLRENRNLSRVLSNPADDPEAKRGLIDRVFGGKVGAKTTELLQTAGAARWSSEQDLGPAFVYLAQVVLLVRAERLGAGERVEDELFRIGRALDSSPDLTQLLGDYGQPVQARLALLDDVLNRGGSTHQVTRELLTQAVELTHGERVDLLVNDLAEVAVTRRGELVARASAAAPLTDAQRTRLTTILTRIYGHPIALKFDVDPDLLGGLHITVADEVIDGAISSRLAAARIGLPD